MFGVSNTNTCPLYFLVGKLANMDRPLSIFWASIASHIANPFAFTFHVVYICLLFVINPRLALMEEIVGRPVKAPSIMVINFTVSPPPSIHKPVTRTLNPHH